jgi:hypothetical protein
MEAVLEHQPGDEIICRGEGWPGCITPGKSYRLVSIDPKRFYRVINDRGVEASYNPERFSNVVRLADHRPPASPDLVTASYGEVLDWAGSDFDRLVAVARARDYYPTWVHHQLQDHGIELTPDQAVILAGMVAAAGPYLTKRQRWIMRQVKLKPCSESKLVNTAPKAPEYRAYKDPARCVRHDIAKLLELGMITINNLMITACGSGGAARASTPHSMGNAT